MSGGAVARDPGGGPRRSWIALLAGVVFPVLLLVAGIVVPAVAWSRLPGQIADHWTAGGTANGTGSRLPAFAVLLVLGVAGLALASAGWAVGRRRPAGGSARRGAGGLVNWPSRRPATWPAAAGLGAAGVFLTATSTGSVIMVTAANLDGGGLPGAGVSPGALPALIGGAAVLAAGTGYLLRRCAGAGAAPGAQPRASLGLRPGERAVWAGRARARWALPTGLLVMAAGAVAGTAAGQWVTGAPLLAVGLIVLCFTSVRVTVAARGLTVGYGPLGLRLTRIPLRRIASAEAVERTAFSFGYRGSLLVFGTAAVALRRGPALRLALRDGKSFLVTVDDAATGAALVNDLVAAAAQE